MGQRPRTWLLTLAAALLLLAGTATLTLLAGPGLLSLTSTGTPTLTSAESTRAAGQLAHESTATVTPRPTATRVLASPTSSLPARLTASPNPLTFCPSVAPATLTLSNRGGHAAAWTASASNGASVAPRSGTLQPGASTDLSVNVSGMTRGTITIRWSGGSLRDSFKVSCHG
jgi:hypothetical protein